ncbi:MAG: ArsA family ATPase [Acidimicrobiales bacterium]
MDVSQFCASTRLFIVAGKGGVGKTTVTAALARTAAKAGLTALIVEIEGKSGLGAVFGRTDALTYEEVLLSAGGGPGGAADITARTLTPDDALIEYLEDHGMRRISKRLANSGALDVVSTAVPGIKDILVLGKIKQLERSGVADLIIVDAPAAGHAITFLTSAQGLLDAARVGPIRTQAQDVVDLLSDPDRCQVLLVTLAEETPVNEVVETAFALEDRVGIKLAPVIVNGVYPRLEGLDEDPAALATEQGFRLGKKELTALRDAADFRRQRQNLQAAQIERLADQLPLPQMRLPFMFSPEIGPAELELLADALAEQMLELPSPRSEAG